MVRDSPPIGAGLREFVQLPSSWPPARVGGGLRAAVLDTTSPGPVAPVAPAACSRRLDFVHRHRKRWTLSLKFEGGRPRGAQGGSKGCHGLPKSAKATPDYTGRKNKVSENEFPRQGDYTSRKEQVSENEFPGRETTQREQNRFLKMSSPAGRLHSEKKHQVVSKYQIS